MTVGENIRRIRKEKRLTQKQLGDLCNPKIAEANIRKYELGKANPKIETIDRIASALGVKIVDIMEQFTASDYKKTSEYQRLERQAAATNGIVSILADIYGYAESKSISGLYADSDYYLVGKQGKQFILENGAIEALYESVKASIIPLVDYMKKTQSENDYIKQALQELDDPGLLDMIPSKYKEGLQQDLDIINDDSKQD